MAEFRTSYYTPMDREYHQAFNEQVEQIELTEPIFPVNRLGETVVESDPQGRNIIQTTQAAIRGGAGTIQLVLTTSHHQAIGGRPKAYGTEVREALRETAKAAGLNIAGVEMPTSSLTNLSGFDAQQGIFSDERRKENLDEVKDAIRFIADVGRGGGVDLVAFEFPREINEQPWNKGEFVQPTESAIGLIVDKRTGRTSQFRKNETQWLPIDPEKGFKETIPAAEEFKQKEPDLKPFTWDTFKQWAEEKSKKEGKPVSAEQLYVENQIDSQIRSLEGQRAQYMNWANGAKQQVAALKRELDAAPPRFKEDKQQEYELAKQQYASYVTSLAGVKSQIKDLEARKDNYVTVNEYGGQKSALTYAEAGMAAMMETRDGVAKGRVDPDKPIHVGPELGWPGYYGGHPDEFIGMIKQAREKMQGLLTHKFLDAQGNPTNKEYIEQDGQRIPNKQNLYFDPSVSNDQAKKLAETHLQGTFDTSHLGMWLTHFKPQIDPKTGTLETEDRRIERFNKEFFIPYVEKIAKANVVGGIQVVDSKSGAHGHVPPGQGIFPLRKTLEIFKDSGYEGFIASEGHEEEKFGQGRIRTKLWEMAGADFGTYFSRPLQWNPTVQNAYFGRTYSPQFIFGGYSPSNEFKLWSDVPLE